MNSTSHRAFTLIELMIVVAIIAIIAAVAIPGLMRSRVGANESSAMGSLKSISAGQECFRNSNIVDLNADGQGEYAFVQEIAGVSQTRTDNAGTCNGPTYGSSPFIPRILGNVNPSHEGAKAGYFFSIYLPTGTAGATNVYPNPVDINLASVNFIAYAHPNTAGRTGVRVFCIANTGSLYAWPNNASTFSGPGNGPAWDAIFGDNDGSAGVTWDDGPDVGGPGQTGTTLNWVPSGG